jgi:ABC-type branched-subunit amino acid transport system substrate-binding protein
MDIQRTIFAQNREAEQRHRSNPSRPYVTLIYFGQLSGLETFTAQNQQLEGMALRQRQTLDAPQAAEPLLRIIVANAGKRMQLADRTVAMLRPLILSDPTIVGVVGLDQTYRSTVDAMEALTSLGLPMVTPTLAADGLDRVSPLYFQINAPTVRQAEIVTAYAVHEGFRTARIIHAETTDDLFVAALRSAVDSTLTKAGLTVEPAIDWKSSPRAIADICEYPGMLFYAGRHDDFVEFLGQFDKECQNRRPAHPIVASSVSRLIEDHILRQSTGSTLPLVYVSAAHLVTCDRDPDPNYPTWRAFLDRARKAPWHACTPDSPGWLSERMQLAYDATHAFLLAVRSLTPTDDRADQTDPMSGTTAVPLTPGAVWHNLANLHYIDGVTGFIDFGTGRVPTKKWTALLKVNEIKDTGTAPVMVYHCGLAGKDDKASTDGCSPGSK